MPLIRARFRDKTRSSHLERKFLLLWQALGGPALEREYRFHPERRWRADFAHLPSRVIVELEGGVFLAGGGRHNRATGFIADCEKHFHAWLLGWSVVRLTAPQITAGNIERIIAFIRTAGVKSV